MIFLNSRQTVRNSGCRLISQIFQAQNIMMVLLIKAILSYTILHRSLYYCCIALNCSIYIILYDKILNFEAKNDLAGILLANVSNVGLNIPPYTCLMS